MDNSAGSIPGLGKLKRYFLTILRFVMSTKLKSVCERKCVITSCVFIVIIICNHES